MNERIPEGWIKMQLHECLTVPHKEKETEPETIERLTVKLYGQGIIRSGKFPKPTPKGRPYFKRFIGELLIGRQNLHNGGLGLVTKETSGLIASNTISSFINRASSDLNFIHQLLSTERFQKQIDSISSGTGQKETSEGQILSCRVVIPPLLEQRKIASIVTSVDKVIENTQKQIKKLRDLKKAVMNELLTKGISHTEFRDSELGRIPKEWGVKSLGDVAIIYSGGTPKRSNDSYYIGCNPWVKSGEVNKRRIYNTEEFISDDAIEKSSAKWVKKGSVLIAMYGATAGKVSRLMLDATINQAISAVCADEGFSTNEYLFHEVEFLSRDLLNSVQGSGQRNLSGQLIKKWVFT